MMDKLTEVKTIAAEAECLFDESALAQALDDMAQAITEQLSASNPLVLSVLNGGIIPTAELVTRLRFPLEIDSIKVGRYQGETTGSHVMKWMLTPSISLQGRTVLIVDDVLDEGITLAEIRRYCQEQGAASVYAAVLVEKLLDHPKPAQADFVAVKADNRYLFGYGMDYKSYLRNWPGIYACKTVY